MKILYIANSCSDRKYAELYSNVKNKPAVQANKFNRLIAEGLSDNDDIDVTILSKLVINKSIYKGLIYKGDVENCEKVKYVYMPAINLKILNNIFAFIYSFLYCLIFSLKNKDSVLMVDVLNISIGIGATIAYKIRGLKSVGIVTDLPQYIGGERIQKAIQKIIDNCKMHILVTESMKEEVAPNDKPYIVIEGISDVKFNLQNTLDQKYTEKIIMYAGSLDKRFGITKLVEAFKNVKDPEARFWIFGSGDSEADILKMISGDYRIQYGGIKLNTEILDMETKVTLLVNPRPSNEALTKFSFPSKTMEYMTTGTAVLTTKLEGIPEEYFNYVFYFEDESVEGITNKLVEILNMPRGELHYVGMKAKEFVLREKSNKEQAKKIVAFIKEEDKHDKK